MESAGEDGEARRSEREALFLAALPEIEQAIRFVARRNRLSAAEAEDLGSEAKLALIAHDYRVLATFAGRSSLRTYLLTVIQRLFLDRRRREWGKWRPSAKATRLGPLAVRLELLLYRDGLSLDEACRVIEAGGGCPETREAVAELAASLPARTRTSQFSIDDDPNFDPPSTENLEISLDGTATAARCQAVLVRALQSISPDDRVMLRLRFEDGVSIADIARSFRLDQKGLYRRMERLLGNLRRALEAEGLSWNDVEDMMDRGLSHLRLPPAEEESGLARTSLEETRS